MIEAVAHASVRNLSDDALIRARRGDDAAFAALVRMHQRSVYGLALRMLNNRDKADDLAQDVFIELHRNLDAIESLPHLAFWLRRVVTHRAIDRFRRDSSVEWVELAENDDLAGATEEVDPLWQRNVERLLGALRPDARAVVLLRFQEDLDPTEIATVLEMPLNTVKSHLKRSLAAMKRNALGGADSDAPAEAQL